MRRRCFLIGSAGIVSAAGIGLGACTLAPSVAQPALFDFGIDPPPAPAQPLQLRLALAEVSASAWLQTPAMVYRLAYRDATQVRSYALSRWAAPPAELVTQRLREALGLAARNGFGMAADGFTADRVLHVHLEAFEQVVDSPTSSRGLVRMRASVSSAERKLRAQRLFQAERPCASVDAQGSAHALGAAADDAIVQVIAWLAAERAS
ncbi:MAG: membrane integrity-associated transporter subunit PqiC [Burkholderiales bacterium]|nr:membrane integrity-associated transporter subunit PqiC [Burkholderiales bacterium]